MDPLLPIVYVEIISNVKMQTNRSLSIFPISSSASPYTIDLKYLIRLTSAYTDLL